MNIFEEIIENLRQFQEDSKDFRVEIHPDEAGFIDLECPKKKCFFEFKIHLDDAENIFSRKSVYCPQCNNKSRGNKYYPTAFLEKTREDLILHFRSALFEGKRLPNRLSPFDSKDAWNQRIKCEECGTRYSVIGVAFFCPSCGHNSVDKLFSDSIYRIQLKTRATPNAANAFSTGLTDDDIEVLIRSLVESCLSDCVSAFEHYSNHYYNVKAGKSAKRNVFQKVQEGSRVWRSVLDKSYEDWISIPKIKLMSKLFQQRHLFIHNQGIVDQDYLERSGDKGYKSGQRIVVDSNEVFELTEILLSLTGELKLHCA